MGTIDLGILAAYLDDYLEVGAVQDYGPNGVQVEGRAEVRRLALGVSACQELFVRAREWEADSILVHHGIFWSGMPYQLTGVQYRRVAELVRSDTSLLAYHLPLDRHAEVGNNAVAARALGLEELEPFGMHDGVGIGWRGAFPEPVPFSDLLSRCEELYGQSPLAFASTPSAVSSVGIVSGGAQKDFYQAIAAGLEVFVTGEVSEWVMNLARESGRPLHRRRSLRHRAPGRAGPRRPPCRALRNRGRVLRRAESGVSEGASTGLQHSRGLVSRTGVIAGKRPWVGATLRQHLMRSGRARCVVQPEAHQPGIGERSLMLSRKGR